MRSALVVTVALVAGWFLRGVNDVESAPAPVAIESAPVAVPASPPRTDLPHVDPLRVPVQSLGNRDVFAYREPAPRGIPQAQRIAQPVAISQPVVVAADPTPAPPARPQFDGRFLGAFGSRDVRVAAFSRNGEIVTVRVGDRIGAFTVQAIGNDEVEVRAGDGAVQRIALSDPV